MPIILVILIILFVGVIVTLIQTQVPDTYLAPAFKKIIMAVAIIGIILWLIYMWSPGSWWNIRLGPH
jgi:hypothetical protein